MAYSTQANVQSAAGGPDRLTQMFDWEGDADPAKIAANVADCVVEADALIDSFACKRYTVPFALVPPIIVRVSARLAIVVAARRRGMLDIEQQRTWDELAATEQGKEGWLYRLATGVVSLGVVPSPDNNPSMQVDEVDEQLPCDRDASRDKLAGYW